MFDLSKSFRSSWAYATCLLLLYAGASRLTAAVNYEEAPIHYRTTVPVNAITRLQEGLDAGDFELEFDEQFGYLPSLLKALEISPATQVMPFAKLSRQNPKISPDTPRAIYFNDDIHIGYVQQGLIEIAVTDPKLGMVFYVMEQKQVKRPKFENQSASCLTCHGAARTKNVPGLQVRSVIPDEKGEPVLAAGSYRTDHTSPIGKRWGGWYVTGQHGSASHLGNLKLLDSKKPKKIDNSAGQNVTDLTHFFDTTKYLSPHSDIIALMVLEHQADALNLVTIANFETRHALYTQDLQLQQADANVDGIKSATQAKISKAGDALLKYLLFHREHPLTEPMAGTSEFVAEFAQQGPFDRQGRSLREFELRHRIFKYPLSYVVYSNAFQALPPEMKEYLFRRLKTYLTAEGADESLPKLDRAIRQSIYEILSDTHPEFVRFAVVDR